MNDLSTTESVTVLKQYHILVREEWGGVTYWREIGRDDDEEQAWNYAYTWLMENSSYFHHEIGVLEAL